MTIPIVLCCSAALIIVVCARMAAREHADFMERFPPISDAEFIARCSPGTNPEVALQVRRIVAEFLSVEYERIHPSSRFVEDLKCD